MSFKGNGKFVAGFTVIVLALGYLAFSGYEESKAYYRTVAEVKVLPDDERHLRLKVNGNVEEGSIRFVGDGVDFLLIGDDQSLPVEYRGSDPVPDTFRDGSEAIVTGNIRDDGVFEAKKIQAKCASKYEATYDSEAHTITTVEEADTY